VFEYARPGLLVALARLFIRETRVAKPKVRSDAIGAQLYRHDRFNSQRGSSDPGDLHKGV
jgi:hypothetical protein